MSAEAMQAINETTTEIHEITEADLNWWIERISTLDWVFAVTYAEGAPHEYIRDRTVGMTETDFERAFRVIYTFGEPQKFYKRTRLHLVHNGWRYWTIDPDHRRVNLVNRSRADQIYGAQNAPRTHSVHVGAYDAIAYWDSSLSATEAETLGFRSLIEEVTGGCRKCRTPDLGAGTGFAGALGVTDSFRLTAVDPSQAILNRFVYKYPLVARVEPMTFGYSREQKALTATRFDLVVTPGGSASYLTEVNWSALPEHAKGRYVLSVFAEGDAPNTDDLYTVSLAEARERAHAFVDEHGGRIHRVGRFEVAVANS